MHSFWPGMRLMINPSWQVISVISAIANTTETCRRTAAVHWVIVPKKSGKINRPQVKPDGKNHLYKEREINHQKAGRR